MNREPYSDGCGKRSHGRGRRRRRSAATRPQPPLKLLPRTSLEGIHLLSKRWGIAGWDLLIAGDGSGQGWGAPCGWSAILVDRHAGGRKLFYGAMNLGTSGLAELIPYVQALSWYEHGHGKRRRAQLVKPILSVAIVTDCRGVADQGNMLATGAKESAAIKASRPFWVALLDFERKGYALSFHWAERATSALNVHCDDVAGRARLAVQNLSSVKPAVDPQGREVSIYHCNSDDDDERTPLHDCAVEEEKPTRKGA